jgi:Zn-dependent protease with chaperone function
VLEIVLGILGSLVTAWFSRLREFRADSGGATLAGRENMIGALRRLLTTFFTEHVTVSAAHVLARSTQRTSFTGGRPAHPGSH